MPWVLAESGIFRQRLRRYEKKYQAAATQALVNAATYFETLKSGVKPLQINAGFIHEKEPGASIAVDERGSGQRLHPTRLYLYPDVATEILWFITIGDKGSQKRTDIPAVRQFLTDLEKAEGKSDE